jgi:hypothetical protein
VTNEQLFLAIGIPVVFYLGLMLVLLVFYIHERFRTLDRRLCDMRADWRVELKYAEDGLTARLKRLEQR